MAACQPKTKTLTAAAVTSRKSSCLRLQPVEPLACGVDANSGAAPLLAPKPPPAQVIDCVHSIKQNQTAASDKQVPLEAGVASARPNRKVTARKSIKHTQTVAGPTADALEAGAAAAAVTIGPSAALGTDAAEQASLAATAAEAMQVQALKKRHRARAHASAASAEVVVADALLPSGSGTNTAPEQPPNKRRKVRQDLSDAVGEQAAEAAPRQPSTQRNNGAKAAAVASIEMAEVGLERQEIAPATNAAPKQARKKRQKANTAEPVALPELPEVDIDTDYEYPPGQQPYKELNLRVNETELLDPLLVSEVDKAKTLYNKTYRIARVSEDARVEAAGGRGPDGKKLSRRADTVARKWMAEAGQTINTVACAGHVPGIAVGDRFYLRAEMGVLGLHYAPLGGIDCARKEIVPKGCPPYATSVMVCGGYEDDADDGEELIYTGQGGNDLLGNKAQVGHQKLEKGNLALVGNIRLGMPVRVTRRNKDAESIYGCTFIFDGLYDVIKYWRERGKQNFDVYKYHLRRRPGQGALATQRVEFGGVGAPKNHSANATHDLVDKDMSCGKEPVPVVVTNNVDEQIPAFTDPERIPRPQDMKGGTAGISESARAQHLKSMEYLTACVLGPGVHSPAVPHLPAKYQGQPHEYLKYLNGGCLPYHNQEGGSKKKHSQSQRIQPVVYECGPWTNCPLGSSCPQAASQKGLQYRLELFMTPNKGWGVRSWDTIPMGAFVMEYTGTILPMDHLGAGDDQNYTFNLAPRPDCQEVKQPTLPSLANREIAFVLDAKHEGNVARFVNHSCDPNLYVQPVLSAHHDIDMTKVCFFAAVNIPPLTEMTIDYGEEFVKTNLTGECLCNSASCVSTLQLKKCRGQSGLQVKKRRG